MPYLSRHGWRKGLVELLHIFGFRETTTAITSKNYSSFSLFLIPWIFKNDGDIRTGITRFLPLPPKTCSSNSPNYLEEVRFRLAVCISRPPPPRFWCHCRKLTDSYTEFHNQERSRDDFVHDWSCLLFWLAVLPPYSGWCVFCVRVFLSFSSSVPLGQEDSKVPC